MSFLFIIIRKENQGKYSWKIRIISRSHVFDQGHNMIRFKITWSDRRNPLKHPRLSQGVSRLTHKKLPTVIKNAIYSITLAYEISLYRYLSYPDVAVCTHMYTCKLACVWYIDMCTNICICTYTSREFIAAETEKYTWLDSWACVWQWITEIFVLFYISLTIINCIIKNSVFNKRAQLVV